MRPAIPRAPRTSRRAPVRSLTLPRPCSFFDGVKRIGAPGYIPNESDVLHARTKTTGISETKFKSGQLSIQCVLFRSTQTAATAAVHAQGVFS